MFVAPVPFDEDLPQDQSLTAGLKASVYMPKFRLMMAPAPFDDGSSSV